jgi:riboflavin synthase
MFTGLIREKGTILTPPAPSGRGGLRLELAFSAALSAELTLGASLAVAGVCLTVFDLTPGRAAVELAPETLARTTLGSLAAGDEVNLEPALKASDALGGHWVQGHVDGTARVASREELTEHRVLGFTLPPELSPYLVEKGSITVDGVSLTVAALDTADRFSVTLLPHTLAVTTLARLAPGDPVNLEVDILAKYVHRILAARGLVAAAP